MTDISRREKFIRIIVSEIPHLSYTTAGRITDRLLKVEQQARKMHPVAALTKEIAALFPGQFIETIEGCRQTFHGRFKTARVMLNNPDAKWRVDKVGPGVVRITRMEDGARYEKGIVSPIALEIAAMKVGESKLSDTIKSVRSKGQLGTNTKVAARRFLGNNSADWSVRQTTLGVRVTRIV